MSGENTHLDSRFVRKNLVAFTVEFLAYGIAIAFVNYSIVLPKLLDDLGASAIFVGLVTSSVNIIWSAMQFFSGSAASHFRNMKNMLWIATLIGRPIFVGYGLVLYLNAGRNPIMLQYLLLLAILVMFGTDSFGSTVWYDFSARTFPGSKRPGIMATWGILNALAGLLVAGVISRVLGPGGPPFPENYALLFLFSFAFFIISWIAWAVIKEPPAENDHPAEIIHLRDIPRLMANMLREDKNLRLAASAKLLMGLAGMAIPFFVLFGLNELSLPPQTVALFITAQMIGTIGGNIVMGWIGNKWGPSRNILFSGFLYATAPLLAVFLGTRETITHGQGLLFLWVYVCSSVITNASLIGASNYVMDIAPEGKVPIYMSTLNAISSIGMLGPLLGGVLLNLFSYQFMFIFSLGFVFLMIFAGTKLDAAKDVRNQRFVEEVPHS